MSPPRHAHTLFRTAIVAGCIFLALDRPAAAQTSRSAAEALFQAGRVLFEEGKTDEACAKLEEAQRLEPGGGTLLLLGICHEKQGKTASAEAELRSALTIARRDRRADREKLAQKHLDAVAGKAPRARFVGARDAGDLHVRIDDGEALSHEVLGVELPVDPGHHVVKLERAGFVAREVAFDAPNRAETVEVVLPALAPVAPPPKTPSPTDPGPVRTDAGSTRKTVAYVTAGVGVVALAVGTVFGVRAVSLSSDAKALCDPSRCGEPRAFALNDDAKVAANVSNVAIGVGVAAVVTAVVLYLTAPEPTGASASSSPPRRPFGAAVPPPLFSF